MFRAEHCKECIQKRLGLVSIVDEAYLPEQLTRIWLDMLSERAGKLQFADIGFGRAAAAAATAVHVSEIKRGIFQQVKTHLPDVWLFAQESFTDAKLWRSSPRRQLAAFGEVTLEFSCSGKQEAKVWRRRFDWPGGELWMVLYSDEVAVIWRHGTLEYEAQQGVRVDSH